VSSAGSYEIGDHLINLHCAQTSRLMII